VGVRHGRAVHRDLVGPGVEQIADVLDGAHPAADRQRNGDGRGRAVHELEERPAALVRSGDVEEGDLVGATFAVANVRLDGVACVTQPDEVDALDDSTVFHVEARDDATREHQVPSRKRESTRAPAWWLFSGWNWQAKTLSRSIAAQKRSP